VDYRLAHLGAAPGGYMVCPSIQWPGLAKHSGALARNGSITKTQHSSIQSSWLASLLLTPRAGPALWFMGMSSRGYVQSKIGFSFCLGEPHLVRRALGQRVEPDALQLVYHASLHGEADFKAMCLRTACADFALTSTCMNSQQQTHGTISYLPLHQR
jgi:hypothetical protein